MALPRHSKFREDRIGGGGPHKGLRVLIAVFDEPVDLSLRCGEESSGTPGAAAGLSVQNQGISRWIEVKLDHAAQLLDEKRVGGGFEGSGTMRLYAKERQVALHGAMARGIEAIDQLATIGTAAPRSTVWCTRGVLPDIAADDDEPHRRPQQHRHADTAFILIDEFGSGLQSGGEPSCEKRLRSDSQDSQRPWPGARRRPHERRQS